MPRLQIFALSLIMLFTSLASAPTWAKPNRSQIEQAVWATIGHENVERTQFVNRLLVRDLFRLGQVNYKVFEGNGGQGRVSVEFDLVAKQDLYLEAVKINTQQKDPARNLRRTFLWSELEIAGYSAEEVISIFKDAPIFNYSEYRLSLPTGSKTGRYIIELPYQETVNGYSFQRMRYRMKIAEYFPEFALDAKTRSGGGREFHIIEGSRNFFDFVTTVNQTKARLNAEKEAPELFRKDQMAAVEKFFANDVLEINYERIKEADTNPYRKASERKPRHSLQKEVSYATCKNSKVVWLDAGNVRPRRGYKYEQAGYVHCDLLNGSTRFHGTSYTSQNDGKPTYYINISYNDLRRGKPWTTRIDPIQRNPKNNRRRGAECRGYGEGWCAIAPSSHLRGAVLLSSDRARQVSGPDITTNQRVRGLSALQIKALQKSQQATPKPQVSAEATQQPKDPVRKSHPATACLTKWNSSRFKPNTTVDIQLDYDAEGRFTGWPSVIASTGSEDDARAIYRSAIFAIEVCKPLPEMASRKQVVLRFGAEGVLNESLMGPQKAETGADESQTAESSRATSTRVTPEPKADASAVTAKPEVDPAKKAIELAQAALANRLASLAALPAKERTSIAQTELTRMSCQPGSIDGEMGNKTRQAFARFVTFSNAKIISNDPTAPEHLIAMQGEKNPVCRAAWQGVNSPNKLSGRWNGVNKCRANGRTTTINVSTRLRFTAPNRLTGPVTSSWKDARGRTNRVNATTIVTLNGTRFNAVTTDNSGRKTRFSGSLSNRAMAMSVRTQGCTGSLWYVQ